MANELDFIGSLMFKAENGDWFIKPVCDFFGLDYDNQVEKINKDKICQTDTGKFLSEAIFGDKRLRLTLRDRGFARWIQMTYTSNIRVELQEKFELFQANIFDYLWHGNIQKTTQLEDIRKYAENINKAIVVNRQVMEYIAEQKQHRDLCMALPPNEWVQIKGTLTEEKILPSSAGDMKAIGSNLPNDIEKLQRMKKGFQWTIIANKNRLTHQCVNIKGKPENPMPEGYQKEKTKLAIRSKEEQLEIINERIIEVSKKQLENKQQIEILRTK